MVMNRDRARAKNHNKTRINQGRRGLYEEWATSEWEREKLGLEELGEEKGLSPPGTSGSTSICYFPTLSLEG